MTKSSAGRPTFERNYSAGHNLRIALKLLGKTWRKDVDSPNHVHNWSTWTDCGLPRSSNTIDKDIREGVPEKRITAYALCLGLTPEDLCSNKIDMTRQLSTLKVRGQEQPLFLPSGYTERHFDNWLEFNRPTYIQRMFTLMGGVYRMHYILQGIDEVYQCALWIYGAETHRMLMRGMFIMFDNENIFEANIFRWHNNLHTHFLCENCLELGYTMTIDPLRHNIVNQRSPFWLRGTGMTDRGLSNNYPITFVFREEQIPCPEGMSEEEHWQRECKAIRQRNSIAPGEPEYRHIRDLILTPEILTPDDTF